MGIKERRAREKIQRRTAILNAAETMFFEKGVDSTTMEDIADQAELGKGTLYLYFSTKEDIKYAVAERGIEILNQMAAEIPLQDKNAIDKLVSLGYVFIDFAKRYPERFKVFIQMENLDLQHISVSREMIKHSIYNNSPVRFVHEFVREGIEQGLIRDDIPAEIISNTLWSQMFGVVQFAFLKSSVYELAGFTTEQLFENHLEIVLNGIRV